MSKVTENKAFKLFSEIFSSFAFMSNYQGEETYSEKLPENLQIINNDIDKKSQILNEADISLDSDEENVSNVSVTGGSNGSGFSATKEINKIFDVKEEKEVKVTPKERKYKDEGIESILKSLEENQKSQKERDD